MKNCREYCRFSQICGKYYPHFKGGDDLSPDECPMAWKIEDLIMDGADAMRECQDEDDVPFCEAYDGPENEEC